MFKYKTDYTVRGTGSFPTDMLRYDYSVPAASEDDAWIKLTFHRHTGEIELMLTAYHEAKSRSPITSARWASFGWTVTEVYPTEKLDEPRDIRMICCNIKRQIEGYSRYHHEILFPGKEY